MAEDKTRTQSSIKRNSLKDQGIVEYVSNANLVNLEKIPSIPETENKCPTNHDPPIPSPGACLPIHIHPLSPVQQHSEVNLMEVDTSEVKDDEKAAVIVKDPGEPNLVVNLETVCSPIDPFPPDAPVPQCNHQADMMEVDTNVDEDTEKAVVIKDSGETNIATLLKEGGQGGPKRLREDKDGKKNSKRQRKLPEQMLSTSVGIGHSATSSRSLNEKIHNGTFLLNPTRWKTFQRKIHLCDQNATFYENEPRSVRHSKCGKILQMKEPYNIAYFENHVAKCKKTTAAGMPTLASMFSNQLRTQVPKVKVEAKPSNPTPCPGLSASNHSRIPIYLKRSPAQGGGAMRIDKLSSSLYPDTPYSLLSNQKQVDVRAAQKTQYRWRNEPDLVKIYSTACKKTSHISDFDNSPAPCYECQALLNDTLFRKALARDLPDPENVKYTPKVYINNDAVEKWGNIHQLAPLIREFEKVRSPSPLIELYPVLIYFGRIRKPLVYFMQKGC